MSTTLPAPSVARPEVRFAPLAWMRARASAFVRRVGAVLATVFVLGLSLLPLAALLLVLPALLPEESVLSESVRPTRSRWKRLGRRLFALASGFAVLIALLAFAVELAGRFAPESAYFGNMIRGVLPRRLVGLLPPAMMNQWPHVILIVYATDLLLLFAIGKIPLGYNVRNIVVRWRISVLTGLAFTVVVGLLTVMLAFLNGLNAMTSNSGVPGNVFILSDGATDEVMSNLGYGDVGKIELEKVGYDRNGRRLPQEVEAKKVKGPDGREVRLCSKETYYIINHPAPPKPGEKPRRRFVQVRGVEDPFVAGQVHDIKLLAGDWFSDEKTKVVGKDTAVPVVLGEGAAQAFGADAGKPSLRVGDVFKLGELPDEPGGILMWVCGIMKSEGTTFGSEVWVKQARVGKQFGKEQYTTLVMRVADDSAASADAMAWHLRNEFKNPRLKAVTEPEYYKELGKTNGQILSSVLIVAAIMAIGGIFGVMNTMFAAIAQRTRDIGVLRILGFKRWQILVSFMLESLGIAIVGGLIGVTLGSLVDGYTATSIVSSGQGGGKTVILRLTVGADILVCGLLFTLVMGRLGGLVPSLSAMRLGILESLR